MSCPRLDIYFTDKIQIRSYNLNSHQTRYHLVYTDISNTLDAVWAQKGVALSGLRKSHRMHTGNANL